MLRQRTLIASMITAGSTLGALAQEPNRPVEAGRIRAVIAELNKARTKYDGKAFSQLFGRDGTVGIGSDLIAAGRAAIEKKAIKHWKVEVQRTASGEVGHGCDRGLESARETHADG